MTEQHFISHMSRGPISAITTEGVMMRFVYPEHEWRPLPSEVSTEGVFYYGEFVRKLSFSFKI